MKKIIGVLAAFVMAIVLSMSATPAHAAGTGTVSGTEYWRALGGITKDAFQSWANVTPSGSGIVAGSGNKEKWVDYNANNSTFTRNITSVSIHFTLAGDGTWYISNPPNKSYGGKWEISPDAPFNYMYGVDCTSAC